MVFGALKGDVSHEQDDRISSVVFVYKEEVLYLSFRHKYLARLLKRLCNAKAAGSRRIA